ncbi:MAG: T9SS type A sorting domain-containing protein [Calditrichaeota bacterium]|nr:T9SS type A sorting domain-containing protein [Calditrichota bacterium]
MTIRWIISFPVTGGWQDWTTVAQQIVLEAGESTLKIVCNVGGFNINWIEFETVTSLSKTDEHIPAQTRLFQNYPNPFNPETQIHFELEKPSHVNITIFDLQGRALKTITDGYYQAGQYSVKVNISDFPSGTYIYKMTTGTYSEMKKMLLLK